MMQIDTFVLGDYQTNCYILHQEGEHGCVVIDPGYEPRRILAAIGAKNLTLEAIFLTHGHFDHVGAVTELSAETDCAVYLCDKDLSLPPIFTNGPLYYTHTYSEGDTLTVAGLSFRVLHTPGHTPGSVCLFCENAIFSGDTLFAGSCGRTDFPQGSMSQMRQSLARLKALQNDYTVYPGHGGSTTLSQEKMYNPYF